MTTVLAVAVSIIVLPVFLGLALLFGLPFLVVGGWAGGVVAAWPIFLYYHDRFLMPFVPPRYTAGLIGRVQAYVDFHVGPSERR